MNDNEKWHSSLVDDSLKGHWAWQQAKNGIKAVVDRMVKHMKKKYPAHLATIKDCLEGACVELRAEEEARIRMERAGQ